MKIERNQFWEALKRSEEEPLLFVLFTSGTSVDGTPWCPDCMLADPCVRIEAESRGIFLMEVEVGSVQEWKEIIGKHPFKHDPRLRLTSIPTLTTWQRGSMSARVELERYNDSEKLRDTVREFFDQNSKIDPS